jgi:hypothetical protein
MSTVFVSNLMPYPLQLIVNNNQLGTLAEGTPGQAPQPTGFSYSASGGGDFGTQNQISVSTEEMLQPQSGSFSIDPNLPDKVDVQMFIYQGFLSLTEPSGVHMITLQSIGPQELG